MENNAALAAPRTRTACELGFGQGMSVNVHAAGSDTRWYGTDFNPAHAAFARELSSSAGSSAALYDEAGKPVIPESVISFPRWLQSLPGTELEWIATDFRPFQSALVGTRFENCPVTIAPRAIAGAVAGIAICRALAGELLEPAAIEANYVRKSDAELLFKG